jgi:hypothetical protein
VADLDDKLYAPQISGLFGIRGFHFRWQIGTINSEAEGNEQVAFKNGFGLVSWTINDTVHDKLSTSLRQGLVFHSY